MKYLKTAAVLTAAALILISCGKDPSEEILDMAGEYTAALSAGDADAIMEMSVNVDEKDLEFLSEEENENKALIKGAIADSTVFTVDEDSYMYSSKDKTCSVDVQVEICDYEELLGGDTIFDIQGTVNNILEYDKDTFWITLEFSKEDGKWAVSNFGDIKKDVYPFFDIDLTVLDMSEHVTGVMHCNAHDPDVPEYENVDYIQIRVDFDREVEYEYFSQLRYTFEYDGEIVSEGEGQYAWLDYRDGFLEPGYDGLLKSGEYVLTYYYGETVVFQEVVTVTVTAS